METALYGPTATLENTWLYLNRIEKFDISVNG